MHELVASDDLQAMEEAVALNPLSVNQLNDAGLPPLYTAALFRNQKAIEFLIDHGAIVDIFACAYVGKAADAEALLKRSPDLARATAADGMTALHYAARAGQYEVADLLLRHGADVNACDRKGRTALIEACHAGPWKPKPAEEIIQLLLNHDARIDLFVAAAMGRTDLIQDLLGQPGTQIDDLNDDGETALYLAAQNNRLAAAELLVERGADLSLCDAVGTAALHRTSQQCSDELIQFLIDHGADAHLCCYVACGDEPGTREALARDPDAAHEIFYEFNAVGYAIHSWQLNTLRILLQHGSTLSGEDQQHILRISGNDRQLLNELMAIQGD
jgi:ankyrin repeat protein